MKKTYNIDGQKITFTRGTYKAGIEYRQRGVYCHYVADHEGNRDAIAICEFPMTREEAIDLVDSYDTEYTSREADLKSFVED